jgi:hypothetical protein
LCCGSRGELSREERVKKDDLDIFDVGATVIFENAACKAEAEEERFKHVGS